jgi:hypothetical protein
MFSFGPAIKLESLESGLEAGEGEEAEPQSHASSPSTCHSTLLASPFFQSMHRPLAADCFPDRRPPLAMLHRLGWDAATAALAVAAGDLTNGEPGGVGGGGDVGGGCLTEALAATAERLQADYLQYCLAKESARLFYSRLAAQLHPTLPHYSRLVFG